jgi:hypothetical protein
MLGKLGNQNSVVSGNVGIFECKLKASLTFRKTSFVPTTGLVNAK